MPRLFFLLLYLIFTSSNVLAQTAAEKKVVDSEALRFSLMTQRDTANLKNFLADDLLYVHSNGLTETKEEHLRAIGSGKITYLSMERMPGLRVRIYGKWAITNGDVKANGTVNGAPFDIRLKYTAVYKKKKNYWQLLSWQSARL